MTTTTTAPKASPALLERIDRLEGCAGHWVLIRDGEPETDCSHQWHQDHSDHLATCLAERWRNVSLGFVPSLCGYSDYSSSGLVGASNFRVLTDAQSFPDPHDGILAVGYGWNGAGVCLDVLRCPDDAIATVEALERYPLISDDDHSELECEVIATDWCEASIQDRVRQLQDLGLCIFAARDSMAPWRDGFDRLRYSLLENADAYASGYV